MLEDRKRRHEHNSNKRQEGQIDLDVAFLTVMGFAEEERRKEQLKNAWDQFTQEEVQRTLDFLAGRNVCTVDLKQNDMR